MFDGKPWKPVMLCVLATLAISGVTLASPAGPHTQSTAIELDQDNERQVRPYLPEMDCRLAPDLAQVQTTCQAGSAETGSTTCELLEALASAVAGDLVQSQQILQRDLGLKETVAAKLTPLLQMLAMMATDDEPVACFEHQLRQILALFSRSETFMALQSFEALLFFNHIVPLAPENLISRVEEQLDPSTAGLLNTLGEALAELFTTASAEEELRGALDNNPILQLANPIWLAGQHDIPRASLPEDTAESRVDDLGTLHEILNLVGRNRLEDAREELAEARELTSKDPAREGQLALSAGVAFALLGLLEDAAVLLQQADALLASVPENEEAQRARSLGSWFRALALEEIGLPAESNRVATEASNRNDFFAMLLTGMDPSFVNSTSKGLDFDQLSGMFSAVSSLLFAPDRDMEGLETTMAALEQVLPWLASTGETRPTPAPPAYFELLLQVFGHIAENELEKAERTTRVLLEHYPRYQNAWVLALVAVQHWKLGQLPEALEISRRAIEFIESHVDVFRVDETLTNFFGGKGFALHQLAVELAGRLGRHQEAFDLAERGRAWTLRRLLGSPQRLDDGSVWPANDPRAQRLLTQLFDLEQLGRPTEAEKELLSRYRNEYEALRLQSKLDAPGKERLARVSPVKLERLQHELLQEGEAILAYFPGLADQGEAAGRLWVWVVDRQNVASQVLTMDQKAREEAECEVQQLRWRLAPPSKRHAAMARGAVPISDCGADTLVPATSLHGRFIQPIAEELRGYRHVTVVPYGLLNYLPFAALRDPEKDSYMIEQYTLSLAPSVTALATLARRIDSIGRAALILGDPDTQLGDLKGARGEARAIARFLDTQPLLGPKATETAVRARAGNLGLLHLAAHGEYVPANPTFSRIALSSDQHNDGTLTVHEVWDQLNLEGTQLVTLSGCLTAVGASTAGDEVIGLTQAFLVAGSRSVLATLWPVSDQASKELMIAFYRHWRNNAPAAEALRSAQLELMQDESYSAPYFWAGFTLTGDHRARWWRSVRADSSTDSKRAAADR